VIAAPSPAWARDPISRSFVPLVGFNPTYRFFGGLGFFYEKANPADYERKELGFGFHGLITQTDVIMGKLNFSLRLGDRWELTTEHELAKGFEPNYGIGGATRVDDRVDVKLSRLLSEVELQYYINDILSVGLVFDARLRRNRPVSPEDEARQKNPYSLREDTFGLGIAQHADHRNVKANPSVGWYQNATFKAFDGFYLIDGNLRLFQYIVAEEFVVAYQLAGGIAWSNPSYLGQFRLGGTDRLRGFYENRFRGSRYYLQQTELRFPLIGAVSGAGFLEFGEVSNTPHFKSPSVSYGAGLRIGLPPDYVAKIRLDVAFSKDQKGVFLDFGHPF
jgi:outer membrane protein assembly factor BamA